MQGLFTPIFIVYWEYCIYKYLRLNSTGAVSDAINLVTKRKLNQFSHFYFPGHSSEQAHRSYFRDLIYSKFDKEGNYNYIIILQFR